MRQRALEVPAGVVELRHLARELLAQRQRRRVLQVRAADLHDVPEGLGLRRPARRAAPSAAGSTGPPRACAAATFMAVGNTSLVRLPLVHVVVRVDQAALAALAAEELAGAVGQHLVARSCWSACRCPSARPPAGTRRRAGPRAPRRRPSRWPRPSASRACRSPCSRARRPSSPAPARG